MHEIINLETFKNLAGFALLAAGIALIGIPHSPGLARKIGNGKKVPLGNEKSAMILVSGSTLGFIGLATLAN